MSFLFLKIMTSGLAFKDECPFTIFVLQTAIITVLKKYLLFSAELIYLKLKKKQFLKKNDNFNLI